jgi:hypothetical protein
LHSISWRAGISSGFAMPISTARRSALIDAFYSQTIRSRNNGRASSLNRKVDSEKKGKINPSADDGFGPRG